MDQIFCISLVFISCMACGATVRTDPSAIAASSVFTLQLVKNNGMTDTMRERVDNWVLTLQPTASVLPSLLFFLTPRPYRVDCANLRAQSQILGRLLFFFCCFFTNVHFK